MAAAPPQRGPTVIDLVSDSSEDEEPPRKLPVRHQTQAVIHPDASSTPGPALPQNHAMDLDDWNFGELVNPVGLDVNPLPDTPEDFHTPPAMDRGGQYYNIDGQNIFIPDDTPEPERPVAQGANQPPVTIKHEDDPDLDEPILDDPSLPEPALTVDTCLQRVLAIFPDISHEYVINLYNEYDTAGDFEILPGLARLKDIIEKLLSGEDYPKQTKGKQKKRKREEDDIGGEKRWEALDRAAQPLATRGSISAILKADFPEIPITVINKELATNKYLYQTYVALAHAKDTSDASKIWRGRASGKNLAGADTIAANSGWPDLINELQAARQKVETNRMQRTADEAKKQAENDNLQRAIAAGETAECQACFDDLPMNRQIHCNGDTAHFTCFECATNYIKSEVGEARCRVLCTAGCGAGFAHAQLHLLEDKQLLEKLEQLQQEKDIRDAGLDDLEECPFCDYKAILPPIDVDFEFRCQNPECEKVSCRRCKAASHIPKSCEEHAKDNKLNSRHKVEEAMTAALIRSCNKCKKQFIKELGCNKMTCSSCGNLQCYVCSASLKDYNHFDQAPAGPGGARSSKCPLYDNVEERHEREVKEAEAAARAKIIEENPDVAEQDLEIKVSDKVKKATEDRMRHAGQGPGMPAFPAGWFPGRFAQAYGRRLGGHEADHAEAEDDFDEDEEEDLLLGMLPRMGPRRAGDIRAAAIRAMRDAGNLYLPDLPQRRRPRLRGLGAPAADPANPAPPPAAPAPPPPPANPPPAFRGFIPLYGYPVQAPAPPPPPMNPPGANNPAGLQHLFDGLIDDPFGDGRPANPYAFQQGPIHGLPHPGNHQAADHRQAFNILLEQNQAADRQNSIHGLRDHRQARVQLDQERARARLVQLNQTRVERQHQHQQPAQQLQQPQQGMPPRLETLRARLAQNQGTLLQRRPPRYQGRRFPGDLEDL